MHICLKPILSSIMYNRIKNVYTTLKKEHLGSKALLVPEKYWSQFVCVGSASDWHYLFSRIVPANKKKVLIVGVHGGRDYFYFKSAGYDVQGLDLFPDKDFGEVIIGNIETIQLLEKSFDVIVASAVIEHLADDYGGIRNIRRMLKDDGLFIICNPLYNDWEITHMHVYSRKSLRRLVEAEGFRIQQTFEYPNLFFYPPLFNIPLHIFNILTFFLFRKTCYNLILPLFWKLEFFLSRQQSTLFRFFRGVLGGLYNGVLVTLVCTKGESMDYLDFNKVRFEPKKGEAS